MSNQTCINAVPTVIALGSEDCDYITSLAIAFLIATVILLPLGLFNHVLLLRIIFSNGQQMRTLPNIFIANTAVLGMIFLIVVMGGNLLVFGQVAFQTKIIKRRAVDHTLLLVRIYISIASFATLVVMSIDRFLAIVFPFRSRTYRTKRRAILACGLVWIVSALGMIPVLIPHLDNDDSDSNGETPDPVFKYSTIIVVSLFYVIPLAIIIFCYGAILWTVCRKPISSHVSRDQRKRRWKQRIQTLKTIGIIISFNTLCYGYFFGVRLWVAQHGGPTIVSPRLSNTLIYSAIFILQLGTSMNPALYALLQSSFRPYVYKILCPNRIGLPRPDTDIFHTSGRESTIRVSSRYRCTTNGFPKIYESEAGETYESEAGETYKSEAGVEDN